jgi:hypothetical protein
VYASPTTRPGIVPIGRQGDNSTAAKCEAVKSSEKELGGTLATLGVGLLSGERRLFACCSHRCRLQYLTRVNVSSFQDALPLAHAADLQQG